MRHQSISFIKSFIRIVGFSTVVGLLFVNYETFVQYGPRLWMFGFGSQIVAEVLGVIEEIGHE